MSSNSLLTVHLSPNRRFSTPYQVKDDITYPRHSVMVSPVSHTSRSSLSSRVNLGFVDGSIKKGTFGSYLDLKSSQFDLRHQAQQCLDVIHKLEESLKSAERHSYDINETQDGRPSVGDCMNEVNSTITSTLALLQLSDTSDISDLLSKLNDKIFPAPSSSTLSPEFFSIHTLIGKLVAALCQCVEESDYVEDFVDGDSSLLALGKETDIYKQKTLERDQKNEELERKLATMDEGVEFCLSYLKTLVKYFKELRTFVHNRTKEEWNNFRRIQGIDQQHLSNLEALNRRVHHYIGTVSAQPIITQELERLNEHHAEQAIKNYFNQVNNKVLIPLSEHLKENLEKRYNNFKSGWVIEKKKVQDAETAMSRAKDRYFQAGGYFDFSMHRSEKKDDVKRKKELEEARSRLDECEKVYTAAIANSNTCRKQHELFKGSIYCASRILATESDLKLAQSLEHFYRCQLEYHQPIPEYLSSVLDTVKKVEPGTSFAKVVSSAQSSHKKFQIESKFEKYSSSISVDPSTGKLVEGGVEGEDSKRRTLAPSQSSPQASGGVKGEDHQRAAALKAQQTHDLSKLMVPTKCRVCDHFTLLTGVSCSKCDVAVHTKCLPFLIVICGQTEVNKPDNFARCTTFGVSLEDQLIATKQKIPPIVTNCISEIEKRGLDLQGIYRIAGVKNKVETLCAAFESGNYKEIELSDEPPHLIASCLKLYLRQLPEPLLTFRLYDEFIPFSRRWDEMLHNPDLEAAEGEKAKLLVDLQEIIQRLPRPNYIIARKLLRHLRVIHNNAASNCMNSHNLGIVFGPTLLRPVELGISALAEISSRNKMVEIMIDNPCTFELDSVIDDDDFIESPENSIEECKSDSEILSPTGNRRKSRLSLDGGVIRQPVSNIKRNRSIKDITRMTHIAHISQFRETSPFARRKRRTHKDFQQIQSKHESAKSPSLSPVASGDTKVPTHPNSRVRRKSSATHSIDSLSMISVDSMESPKRERLPIFADDWEFKKDSSNLTQDVVSAVFQLNLDDYLRHATNYAHTDDDISPSYETRCSPKSRLRKSETVAASYPNILDATTAEGERKFVSRSYSYMEEPEIGNSSRYEDRTHPGSLNMKSHNTHLEDLDTRSDVTPINRSSSRESSSLDSASDDNTDADCDHENRLFLINIKNEYDHYLRLPDEPTHTSQDPSLPNKELNECQLGISQISSQLDILITDCDKSEDEGTDSSCCSSANSSHYHTVDDHEHPSEEDSSPVSRGKPKQNSSPKKEYKDFNLMTS